MIKKIKLSLLGLFIAVGVQAQDLPKPSPYAEVMQRVGLTDITVMYSRPGVKDRVIFGGLEPFDQVWRTGANQSTKIEFTTDANFGRVDVKAGTYSIVSIPGENEWKVMLNSDLGVQEGSYKAENDVASVTVKPMESDEKTERMTFWFANVTDESADLMFAWENTIWSIPVKVEAKEIAMQNIKDEISKVENAYGLYNSSARYYLDNNQDLDQALEWSKKSVSISEKFWNVYTLSLIYEAKGDKKMAIKTAEKSLELAKAAEYQPYIKMNTDNLAKWKKK
ncbi:MAG: DUF2911 domain-containing protein [Vicingaceae bacterium]